MQVEKFFMSEEMKELLEKQDDKEKEIKIKELEETIKKRKKLYLFISTIWGISIGFLLMKRNLISVTFGVAIGLLVGIAFSNRLEIIANKKIKDIDKKYRENEEVLKEEIIEKEIIINNNK